MCVSLSLNGITFTMTRPQAEGGYRRVSASQLIAANNTYGRGVLSGQSTLIPSVSPQGAIADPQEWTLNFRATGVQHRNLVRVIALSKSLYSINADGGILLEDNYQFWSESLSTPTRATTNGTTVKYDGSLPYYYAQFKAATTAYDSTPVRNTDEHIVTMTLREIELIPPVP